MTCLKIKRSFFLTILGSNDAELIGRNGGEIFTITADRVTVSGLRFSNVKTNYLKENAGIH